LSGSSKKALAREFPPIFLKRRSAIFENVGKAGFKGWRRDHLGSLHVNPQPAEKLVG
jgi:hypothetical protein